MEIFSIYMMLNSGIALLAVWLIVQATCTLWKLHRQDIKKIIFVYLEGYIILGVWTFIQSVTYYPPSDISWSIIIITFLYLAISNIRFYKSLYPTDSCVITKALRTFKQLVL